MRIWSKRVPLWHEHESDICVISEPELFAKPPLQVAGPKSQLVGEALPGRLGQVTCGFNQAI